MTDPQEPAPVTSDASPDALATETGQPTQRQIPEITMQLFKLTNLISRPFRELGKQYDITLNEWRVMVVLAARPGLAAQDISKVTGIHAMTISRAVSSLRTRGRIAESRDPDNHRRTLLWLTDFGRLAYEQIVPHSIQASQDLYSILTQEQVDVLTHCLELLINRAEDTLAH